jgi:hypothetical protein
MVIACLADIYLLRPRRSLVEKSFIDETIVDDYVCLL